MTEHDKATGETCSACGEDTASSEYLVCAACADEHDAVVRRQARDAALEEAAREFDRIASDSAGTMYAKVVADHAARVRALKSRPAERLIPEAEVRRVLLAYRHDDDPTAQPMCAAINEIAGDLGVDLDAGTAGEKHTGPRDCDCNGAPHAEEEGCPGWAGERPARTGGLSGEAAMVADDAVPAPRKARPRSTFCDKDPQCNQFVGHAGPCDTRKVKS